jgi:hypothetical protein
MSTRTLRTRRTVLQTAAAATTLVAPFVRGAHAAGKLSVFKKDLTGLLVVDPYNDFISEGGILWPLIKEIAEVGPLRTEHACRPSGRPCRRHTSLLRAAPPRPGARG